ncbi:MAG: aspartate carbamoyltransferase catalytic subunit [Proteobacteria bacterium]|nr:aspartate carbamoyltransferase catalytic subunit [Pseudomonadota bacterium]
MQHFLDFNQLSDSGIEALLKQVLEYSHQPADPGHRQILDGRVITNLFYEASTRTRVSFEVAAHRLGAEVINISAGGSSVEKGESLRDTLETLVSIGVDAVVVRHPQTAVLNDLVVEKDIEIALINAGDGCGHHPSQALLDAATLITARGSLVGLKLVIAGDIRHSRVARSNIQLLSRLGVDDIRLVGPKQLLPDECPQNVSLMTEDFDIALADANAVMMLRIQHERMGGLELPDTDDYHRRWGLDKARLMLAHPDCVVLHPGPVNRGVEMSNAVADGSQSLIRSQVAMGVSARMAIFDMLLASAGAGQR